MCRHILHKLQILPLNLPLHVQENVATVCNVDDLVDGALQGFAVTVFAFGQTGSVRLQTSCIQIAMLHI